MGSQECCQEIGIGMVVDEVSYVSATFAIRCFTAWCFCLVLYKSSLFSNYQKKEVKAFITFR